MTYHLLVHELTQGAWFILSLTLALTFIYIAAKAYADLGYRADETHAAISLSMFFAASAMSRGWLWLLIWLPGHGYPDAAVTMASAYWIPIVAQVFGVVGGLCAVRVFYPMWVRRAGMFSCDATWLVPLTAMLLFLLVTSLL